MEMNLFLLLNILGLFFVTQSPFVPEEVEWVNNNNNNRYSFISPAPVTIGLNMTK